MNWDNMTDKEKVAALKKAKDLLCRSGRPTGIGAPLNFWIKINKKFAHNVKKSHKTERKVSR